MQRNTVFILLAAAVMIAIALTAITFSLFTVKKVSVLDMQLNVGDYLGFNADNDKLNFGTVPAGTVVQKRIFVYSNEETIVEVKMEGNITQFIDKIEPVKIPAHTNSSLLFTARVPEEISEGNFVGTATVFFRRS